MTMYRFFCRPALFSLLAVGLMASTTTSHAAKASAAPTDASIKTKAKAAKKPSHKVNLPTGTTGESPGERSNRLKRECRGQVNAGACEGYTR